MDAFRPARLSSGLYYADGQPKDEVYVYGSFIQSKMYHEGVTCSDCHNPHTNQLKLPRDQVCNQCHQSDKYRSEKHHFHKNNTTTTCLDCHMTATMFMGVDERNDHSFRIPQPDLSINTKIPNACNKCHIDKPPEWAVKKLKNWYKKRPEGLQQFAITISAQQQQLATAEKKLHFLINDKGQPDIARATALEALSNYPNQRSITTIKQQLEDENPIIRLAALEALSTFDQRAKIKLGFPLIYDDIQSIRMEAARLLIAIPTGYLSKRDKTQLEQATKEYINAQLYNAERPESQVNLASYYFQLQEFSQAEVAYKKAIKLQRQFIPAYLGLSFLLNQTGREHESVLILKNGLQNVPESAVLHHSLGLAYVRQNELDKAINALKIAANNAPDNIQYQYIYGVALHSVGKVEKAIAVLKQAHDKFSSNKEILIALITFNRDAKKYKESLNFAKKLEKIEFDNQSMKK